jgi:hypothetical protein
MKAWKEHEKATAVALGGRRVGLTGLATADVVSDHLSVECKERAELPKWLRSAMTQAVKACRGQQVPLVVLHEKGRRHDNDYVVMRRRDYVAWYGAIDSEADSGDANSVTYEPGDE